jgi:hypothetical protein
MRFWPVVLLWLGLIVCPAIGLRASDRTVLPGVVVGVVDGDTVDVQLQSGRIRVRLHASTPESATIWGPPPAGLSTLVFGKSAGAEPSTGPLRPSGRAAVAGT